MSGIKKYVRALAGQAPIQTYLCKVVNVEDDRCECEPLQGGAKFLDVRLRSILDDNTDGLLLIPKKNSVVLIGIIENNDSAAFLLQCSEIEELKFKNAGGMTIDVLKDIVKLNGDQCKGLVKLDELKDNLDAIKDYLSALKTAVSSGLTAVGVAMAANGPAGATSFESAMASQVLNFKNMENKNVKHG